MDLVVVRGKSVKNTNAYVLLPPDCQKAIEVLLDTRDSSCVATSNKYMFARSNADTLLSGTTDMKELANECPLLEFPDRITSTKLRKYIATVSQVYNPFISWIFFVLMDQWTFHLLRTFELITPFEKIFWRSNMRDLCWPKRRLVYVLHYILNTFVSL